MANSINFQENEASYQLFKSAILAVGFSQKNAFGQQKRIEKPQDVQLLSEQIITSNQYMELHTHLLPKD